MAVKNPIFKILRCPDCGKQNRHTEPLATIPPCPRCGGSPAYSAWYIKVIVDGKPHIQEIGRQKQHAESALKKAEAEIFYDAYQINQESPLLADAINTIYVAKWKKKRAPEAAKRQAERLMGIIGNHPINTIGKRHMHLLDTELLKRKSTSSTCNKYRSSLRSILKYNKLSYDFIEMDPEDEGRIRVVTDQEEKTLLKLFQTPPTSKRRKFYTEMYDYSICLVDTGARASELLNLPPKDLDFTTGMMTIWDNKANKPRSVPMTKRVRQILKKRFDAATVKLFAMDIYQMNNAWNWARKEMGLMEDEDFVAHALRHTCATRLLIAGVDIYKVKEWLGHRTIKTAERYIHLAPQNLKDALSKLEKRKPST